MMPLFMYLSSFFHHLTYCISTAVINIVAMYSGYHIWEYVFNNIRTYFYMKIHTYNRAEFFLQGIERSPVFSSFRLPFTAYYFHLSASFGKRLTLCSFLNELLLLILNSSA